MPGPFRSRLGSNVSSSMGSKMGSEPTYRSLSSCPPPCPSTAYRVMPGWFPRPRLFLCRSRPLLRKFHLLFHARQNCPDDADLGVHSDLWPSGLRLPPMRSGRMVKAIHYMRAWSLGQSKASIAKTRRSNLAKGIRLRIEYFDGNHTQYEQYRKYVLGLKPFEPHQNTYRALTR